MLLDKYGVQLDKTMEFGFDISIIDNDLQLPTCDRMIWSNLRAIPDNWYNMDGAGLMILELDHPIHLIQTITLTPGSITANRGTLQINPILSPEDAQYGKLLWTVINGTGRAEISPTGLVTALSNGTVTVKVIDFDQPWMEATTTVTISGQTMHEDELWNTYNLIKNWDFTSDLTNWDYWLDAGMADNQAPPIVSNGIASMTAGLSSDGYGWHYTFSQKDLKAEANVPYILKFKSWSSAPRSNGLIFEDSPLNNYTRYGASTDAESIKGRAEWLYYTSTEPRWFTFLVVFDKMVPTTVQKIQWNLSTSTAITYLDSVILIKDGNSSTNTDYIILSTKEINMKETVASASMDITSNTNWEVRSDQTWLTVNPPMGTGNQTITFTARGNPAFSSRTATATVFAASLDPQTITVTQDAKQDIPTEPGDTIVENWSSEAWNSYNLIKNWDFTTDLTNWEYWLDAGIAGDKAPLVGSNGTVSMTTCVSPDGHGWHYTLMQKHLKAEANVPYTLKFKSWSSVPRSNGLFFEDSPQNNYTRYGASTDAESINGRAEWAYYTSSEPRWFTFHVVFDKMVPTTVQKIQWNLSTATATSYLDSVILIKDADLLLIKEAELQLSANHLSIGASEANSMVKVSSNTNSMAISDQSWLTVNPPTVTGNQIITITSQANSSNSSRTATVTLYPAGMELKTITITQESTTGVDPLVEDQNLRIFPNPSFRKIKIELNKMPRDKTYLTVTDLTGRTIVKQLIESKEQWIDLEGNPPGIYLINTNLKGSKTQKIILK